MSLSQKDVPVDVFWDFASCPAPSNVPGHSVVNRIRSLGLRLGTVRNFKAYLSASDENAHSLVQRSELQMSGVTLVDVPGRKDFADKMLIVDLLTHALDNPTSVIMLISGDPGFSYALSILRMRNYRNLVLLGPRLEQENAIFASQAALCLNWDLDVMSGIVPVSTPPPTAEAKSGDGLESGIKIPRECAIKAPTPPCHGVIGDRRPSTLQPAQAPPPPGKDLSSAPHLGVPATPNSLDGSGSTTAHPKLNVPAYASSSALVPRPDSASSAQGDTYDDRHPTHGTGQRSRASTDASIRHPSTENTSPPPPEQEDVAENSAGTSKSYAQTAKIEVPAGYFASNWQTPVNSEAQSSLGDWQTASSKRKSTDPAATPDFKVFKPLIRVLKESRANGVPKPLWGVVASEILSIDPHIYKKAGVERFIQYGELAVAKKIVQVGGPTGQQWMRLHPDFKA